MPSKKKQPNALKRKRDGEHGEVRGGRSVIDASACYNEYFYNFYRAQGILNDFNIEEFKQCAISQLPTVFRVNKCKPHWPTVMQYINENFKDSCKNLFESDSTAIFEITFDEYLNNRPLKKWCEFMNRSGRIGFQELASMLPPMLLSPKPGDRILDMCAAPGSKTVQTILTVNAHLLSERNHPRIGFFDQRNATGLIWANDKDAGRACLALNRNVAKTDFPGTILTSLDSNHIPPMFRRKDDENIPILFDRIIADVPCSGDGTLRKNQDIWRKWSVKDTLELHLTQFKILLRGLRLLKPGGRLVYSTCSLSPIENEAVVASALRWYHEDLYNLHARQKTEKDLYVPVPTDFEMNNLSRIRVVRPSTQETQEMPSWLRVEDGLIDWKVPLIPPFIKKDDLIPFQKRNGGGIDYTDGFYDPETNTFNQIDRSNRNIKLHPRSSKAAIRFGLNDPRAHLFIKATMMPPVNLNKNPKFWEEFECKKMQYLSENAGTGEGEKSPEDVMKREAILLGSMPQIFRDLEHQIIESLPRCMRLLPQHNNSGGFFVAVFEKDVAPFTFQNEAHELEMINHINVRTKLRQQAFQRVCQMQQDILQSKNNNRQEEEKDELQLSGNEQSSEVEEDDVKKEVEDGLNIDSVETGEEEETNNNDKADLNSCSMIKNTSSFGCRETHLRLQDTFLFRSQSMQRRKSTFLTWRFDVFPPARPRRGDNLEFATETSYRLPVKDLSQDGHPVTHLAQLKNHPEIQQLADFFGLDFTFHAIHIAADSTSVSSTTNTTTPPPIIEIARVGGLSLFSYLDYKGDPTRIFATSTDAESILLSELKLNTVGSPVPALLQLGVRLFEHLKDFCPHWPLRWRVSQQGATLMGALAKKRRAFVNLEIGFKLLKEKNLRREDLIQWEIEGKVEGFSQIWEDNLGSCVVCVRDGEPHKDDDGSDGYWLSCFAVALNLLLYADKEQANSITEVLEKWNENKAI